MLELLEMVCGVMMLWGLVWALFNPVWIWLMAGGIALGLVIAYLEKKHEINKKNG